MHSIRIREMHNQHYINGIPEKLRVDGEIITSDMLEEIPLSTGVNEDDGKQKYWKSKRGKVRLAGKSKPRPGEEEIWLTSDEYEAMS